MPVCVLETVIVELFISVVTHPFLITLCLPLCRWDFCFHKGSVIEHIDGHTDIVHKLLFHDWLPWSDLYISFSIEHLFIYLQELYIA